MRLTHAENTDRYDKTHNCRILYLFVHRFSCCQKRHYRHRLSHIEQTEYFSEIGLLCPMHTAWQNEIWKECILSASFTQHIFSQFSRSWLPYNASQNLIWITEGTFLSWHFLFHLFVQSPCLYLLNLFHEAICFSLLRSVFQCASPILNWRAERCLRWPQAKRHSWYFRY